MLNDPMLIAEMIAEKRDAEDAKWRAEHGGFVTPLSEAVIDEAFRLQYQDLKARERYHTRYIWSHGHADSFARCPHRVCRGEVPVPR